MNPFKNLNTVSVADVEQIARPSNTAQLDYHSPAVAVLTDFHQRIPMLLEQGTGLEEARSLMGRAHVKLALIIRRDERFCGIVTASDLASVKVMRVAESARLRSAELTVEDIMTPRSQLRAIQSVALRSAKVGDVLETMKRFGAQHMLVVDAQTREICGLISASDIARCLHISLNIPEKANSFADIYRELHA